MNNRAPAIPLVRRASALILLAGVAALGRSAAPATQPAPSAADLALMHRMETGGWRERQAAQDELETQPGMDDATVHALIADTKSPEAEARLQAILKYLADQRDEGTSLITLHMKDAPAKAVYAELFRQAFATVDAEPADLLDEPSIPKMTIDVDRQPFWTVEQQLRAMSHVGLSMGLGGIYELRGGATLESGPQAISGPLLCVLTHGGNYFGRRFRRGGPIPHVELMIYPEPKVRVLMLNPQIQVEQAMDNNGNPLKLSATHPALAVGYGQGQLAWQIPFDPAPTNPGDHLTRLRATLGVELALRPQHIVIADLMHAGPRDFHIGPMTMRFDGCKKINGWYQVTFSATGAYASLHLTQMMQEPIAMMRVLDADGTPLAQGGMSYSTGPQGASITYMFGAMGFVRNGMPAEAPVPSRLICDPPSEVKSVAVPIDFKDIDVPISGNG